MERKDIFLNKEFCEYYRDHKHEQYNITDMMEGNINRMCVCETKEELNYQFFNAVARLVELNRLQTKKLDKIAELLKDD